MSSPWSAEAALSSPERLAIHLDLVGGLSGDMFVAALVDALPALEPIVLAQLAALQPAGLARPAFTATASGGLRARRFGFDAQGGRLYARARPRRVGSAVAAEHGTPYLELRRRIAEARLSPPTRTHALALLGLLAGAEASVHGVPIEDVHLHELADWDSLMDMVAAGCIAARLDGAHWTASLPPLGSGSVRTAHGLLPVPAPATTLLLTGYPTHDDGIGGERVTPTGAAILRHLVAPTDCGARRAGGRLVAGGYGAGTRTLPGLPNVVRALVLERAPAASTDTDLVSVLEFDIDDMTGEEIALAAERLRAHDGVIDVSVGARHGKKGRMLAEFRLLVAPHATDAVAQACFGETSTLGLRIRDEQRRVLHRAEVTAKVGAATVDVKVAERPGGKRTAKAAHDAVAAMTGLGARRKLRAAASARALEGGDE